MPEHYLYMHDAKFSVSCASGDSISTGWGLNSQFTKTEAQINSCETVM